MSTRLCNYCTRLYAKPIKANSMNYCSRLCAAFSLILSVYKEDGIDDTAGGLSCAVDALLEEGPLPIPVKVRFDDALEFLENEQAPEGFRFSAIIIDDDGSPDWTPPLDTLVRHGVQRTDGRRGALPQRVSH